MTAAGEINKTGTAVFDAFWNALLHVFVLWHLSQEAYTTANADSQNSRAPRKVVPRLLRSLAPRTITSAAILKDRFSYLFTFALLSVLPDLQCKSSKSRGAPTHANAKPYRAPSCLLWLSSLTVQATRCFMHLNKAYMKKIYVVPKFHPTIFF